MNNWLSEPPSIPNNGHGGFAPSTDSSMTFIQQNSTIDPAHFQQQRFLNGAPRNPSPAFHNPFPPVNPVIPLKRPREESIGTSPRQAPGNLPGQRAHTPGQAQFSAYGTGPNGTPHFQNGPTQYQQHLQAGGTSNATPSPTPQSLVFPQHAGNQRVATASPNPFSPHHPGPQMSPAHSDHTSRVGTPHDTSNGYAQQATFGQPFNQIQYGSGVAGVNPNLPVNQHINVSQQQMQNQVPQAISAQQRAYQMQMQAQARQLHAQAGHNRPPSGGPGPMGNPNMPVSNPQLGQMQQNMRSQPNPEAFARGVLSFMQSRGVVVSVNPVICGRPLTLMQLFFYVVKSGGSGRITKLNQWPVVAQHFQFPPPHIGLAAQELRDFWGRNVTHYEQAWLAKQQRQGQPMRTPSMDFDQQHQLQNQLSPSKPPFARPDHGSHPVDKENIKTNGMALQTAVNGYAPPSQPKLSPHQPQLSPSLQHKPNMSHHAEGNHVNGISSGFSPSKRLDSGMGKKLHAERDARMPKRQPLVDSFEPEILPGDESRMHGPVYLDEVVGISNGLLDLKPVVPNFRELGIIDLHALNMSLKSGIIGEVRLALDTLTTISVEPTVHLSLEACGDLVDTLIDCAQDQVDLLAKNATEVSDEMVIAPYEDVLRGSRIESESLQDVPEMGSLAYDLDRAVDRLVCITTLIRNFSFLETNFSLLGTPDVVRLLTTVIKYLGTKEMFLRTYRGTMDFMKDVVVFLSNLSHSLQLPGKEEALCLLHFLLSFAPCPHPLSSASKKVNFASYDPNIHKYTPSAVDSLAKLLARDDPNRTYYKAIFASDSSSSPPHELLTRTFGLAIAPIPTNPRRSLQAMVDARKPFLLQGMLAAEILSSLVPSSDSDLAHSWLSSTDGFAATLMRLVLLLVVLPRPQQPNPSRHPSQRGTQPEPDLEAINAITRRGIAILRRLAEKAKMGGSDQEYARLAASLVPKNESLLETLMSEDVDGYVVRQLHIYTELGD